MPAESQLLRKAISFYQSGDCETARRLLLGSLHIDSSSQSAWIWYAETFPNPEDRLRIYQEALSKYPHMEKVNRAYLQLRRSALRQAGAETPTVPTRPSQAVQPPPAVAQPRSAQPLHRPAPASHPVSRPAAVPRPAARQSSRAWVLFTWMVVIALLFSTVFFRLQAGAAQLQASSLRQKNARLENSYRFIQTGFDRLQQEHQTLQRQFADLTAQHNGLSSQYNSLNAEHQQLQSNYLELNENHVILTNRYQELEGKYAALYQDFTDLQGKAVVPPYITVHQREVTMAFYKLDKTILYWSVPFDSLEKDIERGFSSRKELYSPASTIWLSYQDGTGFETVDFRKYVDPRIFTKVIPDLYAQAESDDAFIREVWNIVTQLAIYASDPEIETPRYPLETLLAGGGDCEDISILFASMIKAAPVSWSVSLVYMNGSTPTTVTQPNHVIVAVDNGSMQYLVETTSSANMTPYTQGVAGWFLEIP